MNKNDENDVYNSPISKILYLLEIFLYNNNPTIIETMLTRLHSKET